MISALHKICNKIWQTGEWPIPWTQSLIITLPKKGNLQQCKNYCTISLICHPSKVLLKVLLNRLKPRAESIIAEEQARFRSGRSTTEQIFNLRILCERYLQHRQDLYHVFIDFKKAFDRVWHKALWSTMRLYNINVNLIQVIENLYNKATSAVCLNGDIGDWFRTTVGVRQGCLFSPTFFNIFLGRIMTEALEDHQGTSSKYYVQVEGYKSSLRSLDSGVPQGSVLGPLLYVLYTSPVADIIKSHDLQYHFYTDDTQLYITFKTDFADDACLAKSRVEHCVEETAGG